MFNPLKISNLTISKPIVQGGMGVGISLSGLASAVANEGGCGVISGAGLGLIHHNLSPNYLEASILGLKEEIRKAREKTRGVIGVNISHAVDTSVMMAYIGNRYFHDPKVFAANAAMRGPQNAETALTTWPAVSALVSFLLSTMFVSNGFSDT